MKHPELGVRIWIVILGLVLVWLIQGRVSTVLTPATFEQVVILAAS
jgi:hypothetical protein